MNEIFRTWHRVRFGECDHAGIVFYPRYGEMSHAVIEAWFREGLDCDLPTIIERFGVVHPLVKLEMEFLRPSRYNDLLEFALQVQHLGRSSLTVRIAAMCGDEERVRMTLKMVNSGLQSLRSEPLPDALREGFARYLAVAPTVVEA